MKRLPLLFIALLSGVVVIAGGCASGNPNISDAESSLEDQNYEQALASVDQAIAEDSTNAEAYVLRGRILQDQAATVEDPQEHQRLIDEMMQAYDRAIEVDSGIRGEVQTRLQFAYVDEMQRGAEAFNETQDYGAAAAYFGSAARIEPDSASASLNQAYALINAGDQAAAIPPMERVIESIESPDTSDVDNFTLLGQLYMADDQGSEAVDLLEQAREYFPDDEEIQSQLVNAYLQSGETERAMEYYSEAIENEPDNELYRYNYGSMLLEAERYDEAIEQLQAAVELDQSYTNAQYNLGAAYVNKAVDLNDRIVELDDELSETRDQLSQQEVASMESEIEELAAERQELFESAIPHLEQARQQGGTDTASEESICRTLFQAYVQTGQQEQAQTVQACAGMEDADVNNQ